jgi:hypothetical protein
MGGEMKVALFFRTESGDDYLFKSDETKLDRILIDLIGGFEEFAWAYTWKTVVDDDIDKETLDKMIYKYYRELCEEFR